MKKKNALIIIDLQKDFIPGGALAVSKGDEIIPLINQLVHLPFDVKVASQDWHPAGHGSFASTHKKCIGEYIVLHGIEQILWPDHCVQETVGSEFASGWNSDEIERVFYKGTDVDFDSYSAFFDNGHHIATGLEIYLKDHGVNDLYVAGLATDYCVKYSVLDACRLGFNTYVVKDACRGVNLLADDSERAFQEMTEAGAQIITMDEIKND